MVQVEENGADTRKKKRNKGDEDDKNKEKKEKKQRKKDDTDGNDKEQKRKKVSSCINKKQRYLVKERYQSNLRHASVTFLVDKSARTQIYHVYIAEWDLGIRYCRSDCFSRARRTRFI